MTPLLGRLDRRRRKIKNGNLVFGNARYLMSKLEYEFWTSNENLLSFGEMMRRFARKNLPAIQDHVQLLEGDEEVLSFQNSDHHHLKLSY